MTSFTPPADYDAIITLGGGSQRTERCNSLPLHVLRRLELAAFLFKNQRREEEAAAADSEQAKERMKDGGKESAAPAAAAAAVGGEGGSGRAQIICLSAGTPHRPNFVDAASGFHILESTSAAAYLSAPEIGIGIPARCIWRETTSLDTIGNAYFLRSSFLDPATPVRFRRLAVITSDFHMPRTRAIFDWILLTSPCDANNKNKNDDDNNRKNDLAASKQLSFTLATPSLPQEFKVTLWGTSRNALLGSVDSKTTTAPSLRTYDLVDYYSVSDDNTMSSDDVLKERIARELQSLKNFEAGIVKALAPLRNNDPQAFIGAVQEFVLTDHEAYCTHEKMLQFPAREVWQANETY